MDIITLEDDKFSVRDVNLFLSVKNYHYLNGIKNKYNGHIFCIDTGMSKAFQQMPNNETTVHYLEVINNKIKLH